MIVWDIKMMSLWIKRVSCKESTLRNIVSSKVYIETAIRKSNFGNSKYKKGFNDDDNNKWNNQYKNSGSRGVK